MRPLAALLSLLAAPAPAQLAVQPLPLVAPAWDPAAAYVTAGQDEPGYRSWYLAASWRPVHVKAFHDYLVSNGVAGIVPTWQLLRTASSWERCGAQPFEVPPSSEWPHIVQTLRYVRAHVVPEIGPVEVVSGYRNPLLNGCAGGAPESAHKHYSAIDLVPLRPITREHLMQTLCTVHSSRGSQYQTGLGFYAYLRFHVDSTKFRRWGTDSSAAPACTPIMRPEDVASMALSPSEETAASSAAAEAPAIAEPQIPIAARTP
ncbi:MAG TPA: D-Ala-D-Ala carboxypeptidase family metallohydrolase [Sphingomicrobium sp.]|nr:D-Ala-D-Ala carboxypeptidase family metallohydrolase [Sphingomicrobium sp.]